MAARLPFRDSLEERTQREVAEVGDCGRWRNGHEPSPKDSFHYNPFQLKADPKAKTAATAFLVPPGVVLASIEGATSKENLQASLKKAASGCGPGASFGCCPPPKK
jgi:hypothetical protein